MIIVAAEDVNPGPRWSGTYKTMKRTEQTQQALFGHEPTGLGSAREVDEYRVSPNLIRQLAKGCAIVKINDPQFLDLVTLDYIDTAQAPLFSPPPGDDRPPSAGLDLRGRAARSAKNSPAPASVFEGA